jgi:hypothetical protein
MNNENPQHQNAEALREFWDRHSPPERDPARLAKPGSDAVSVMPESVAVHEKDDTGHTTRLVLRPPGRNS